MQVKARVLDIVLVIIVLTIYSYAALADPTGPTLINGTPERGSISSEGTPVQAQAGNVTALKINATRITERWQGYYGNITGTITLDDGSANTMYSWHVANPQGEVYASNGSITDWSDVFCFNFSNLKDDDTNKVQRFNGTDVENTLGMDPEDADGFDETFNETFTGSFTITEGNTVDKDSGCSLASLYVNDNKDMLNFNETVLTDNNSIIYTTTIEQSQTGFQGSELDFQMIVGENGDTTEATNYYFYVQLS